MPQSSAYLMGVAVCAAGILIPKDHLNQSDADMNKKIDLEKMQAELNAYLKQKYGKDVNVSIGANIVPLDKLDEKIKELDSGIDNVQETKQ